MRAFVVMFFALVAAGQPPAGGDPNIVPRIRGKNPEAADSVTDRRATIRVDTNLVQIPVTVTDPRGTFVTGLDKENFKLAEDKLPQEILNFSSEDAPMSIGLVFDTSGSMGPKLQTARKAASEFMKTANPVDEFFLTTFAERPEMVIPFTTSIEEVQNRLMFAQSKGRTALLDGVYLAMNQMKKAHNPRKAILIISDGGDNSSRYTSSEVKNAVREADVQIYGIGIYEGMGNRGRTPEELGGPDLLHMLASLTAGTSFEVGNLRELPDVAMKIAIELRHQYMLSYTSTNKARDGKYRRVEVKMAKVKGLPPLKATFRTGYYAPAQ
jgi:Ca-activated chloride channel family protein